MCWIFGWVAVVFLAHTLLLGWASVCTLSHFSCVRLFVILWTVAYQAPLSMWFSRQEYQSGWPCPLSGDLLDPGIELNSPVCPALQADSLSTEPIWEGHLLLSKPYFCLLNSLKSLTDHAKCGPGGGRVHPTIASPPLSSNCRGQQFSRSWVCFHQSCRHCVGCIILSLIHRLNPKWAS